MHIPVKNNVRWVGKIDWELQRFHGDEYSTNRGSTYNSYLITEEKNVLIDTVWKPYAAEFVDNLQQEIPLDKLDFIVANHGEVDHSGALSEPATTSDLLVLHGERGKIVERSVSRRLNFKTVKTATH